MLQPKLWPCDPAHSASMCDSAYMGWCRDRGVQMYNVQPAYVSEGWRGVVATAPLNAGDIVMLIPSRLLMSATSARQDPVLGTLLLQYPNLSSHQVRHNVLGHHSRAKLLGTPHFMIMHVTHYVMCHMCVSCRC